MQKQESAEFRIQVSPRRDESLFLTYTKKGRGTNDQEFDPRSLEKRILKGQPVTFNFRETKLNPSNARWRWWSSAIFTPLARTRIVPPPRHMSTPRRRLNQAVRPSVTRRPMEGDRRAFHAFCASYITRGEPQSRFEGACTPHEQYYFSSAENHGGGEKGGGQVCFATRYQGATPSR